ncbi:MAG: AbrB/MazE/SpoVT family DNA-binding domain-containing protein [Rubrivivax sp.]
MQVTVSDKGQITLPHGLRQRLGIAPGQRLEIDPQEDGSLRVRKLAGGSSGLAGRLAVPGERTRPRQELEEGVAQAVAERAAPSGKSSP